MNRVWILSVVMIVAVVVLGCGAPTYVNAAPDWKTFYSPEYQFSFDYPNHNNQTVITDKGENSEFYKLIETSSINFYVKVIKANMDPQEFLVAYSQALPSHYMTIEGGIKSILVDWIPGYMYNAINNINGAMVTGVNFEHNGFMYTFLIEGPQNSLDRTDTSKVVKSIKFFD